MTLNVRLPKTSLLKLILASLFLYLPYVSIAWGLTGHRVVGEIANSYLTPNARIQIGRILGNESIAMSSNWADFIRSDSSYKYLDTWHYVNVDSGLNYSQVKAFLQIGTATNAFTKTNFLIKELKKKNLRKDQQQFYLRLLMHFVGDIHQPLHVGRKSDLGGNTIRVNWFSEPSNLHRVWDDNLIEHQKLSYTEYTRAINHTTPVQLKKWQGQPMEQWFYESYEISEQLHTEIKQPQQRLGYEYNFAHLHTVNQRLLQAGVRLAGILNDIFKDGPRK
jgi:hypothetical protein